MTRSELELKIEVAQIKLDKVLAEEPQNTEKIETIEKNIFALKKNLLEEEISAIKKRLQEDYALLMEKEKELKNLNYDKFSGEMFDKRRCYY